MRFRPLICAALLLLGLLAIAEEPVTTPAPPPPPPPKPVQVEGTCVELAPPAGYEKTPGFVGFMNRAINASIAVKVSAEPYAKTIASFTKEKLAERQETLYNTEPTLFGEVNGQLLVATLKANNVNYGKVYGIFGDAVQTVLVSATIAEASARQEGVWDALLAAVRSARFAADVFAGKPFALKLAAPLAFPRRFGNGIMVTDIEKPTDLTKVLYFFAAKQEHTAPVTDAETFARGYLTAKCPQVKAIQITEARAVKLNGMTGSQLTGTATYASSGKPCIVFLTILPAERNRYFVLQGFAPQEREPVDGVAVDDAAIFKAFTTLTNTFRRKNA
jgi:hypothetical protein